MTPRFSHAAPSFERSEKTREQKKEEEEEEQKTKPKSSESFQRRKKKQSRRRLDSVTRFTGFYRVFTEFDWVLPSFTGYYKVLLGLIRFYLVL